MTNPDLLKKAQALGFPLLQAETQTDTCAALADIIKSQEPRLWEGFPVMLANAAEKGDFSLAALKAHLHNAADRQNLRELVSASLGLYHSLGVKFAWAQKLAAQYPKEALKEVRDAFKQDTVLKIGDFTFPTGKLKSVFNAYNSKNTEQIADILSAREGFGLEYAMSQIFTLRQKDLFFKKLRGEKLTKTEKEYFSRVVKRKAAALANADLHHLAAKLLE